MIIDSKIKAFVARIEGGADSDTNITQLGKLLYGTASYRKIAITPAP